MVFLLAIIALIHFEASWGWWIFLLICALLDSN